MAVAQKPLMGRAAVGTPRQLEEVGSTAAGALRGSQATGGRGLRKLLSRPSSCSECSTFPSHEGGLAKS